jgi:chromosomal replication initiation ATPase DnaA
MNVYTAPGISIFDEKSIIKLIKEAFGLKNEKWVTNGGGQKSVIPRQVLMSCLVDFLGYSQKEAGYVCLQHHCTARHSHARVHDTLMNDREYGPIVKTIYGFCKMAKMEECITDRNQKKGQ